MRRTVKITHLALLTILTISVVDSVVCLTLNVRPLFAGPLLFVLFGVLGFAFFVSPFVVSSVEENNGEQIGRRSWIPALIALVLLPLTFASNIYVVGYLWPLADFQYYEGERTVTREIWPIFGSGATVVVYEDIPWGRCLKPSTFVRQYCP